MCLDVLADLRFSQSARAFHSDKIRKTKWGKKLSFLSEYCHSVYLPPTESQCTFIVYFVLLQVKNRIESTKTDTVQYSVYVHRTVF